MHRNFPKIALGASLLLSASLLACNSDRAKISSSSETVSVNFAPTVAELKEAEISSETPVEVSWRYCNPSIFALPTEYDSYPVDEDGCRINNQRLQVWPLENGTVEVYFVRDRLSPSTLGLGESEAYRVATKSRGCDPEGPQDEGFYRSNEGVGVIVAEANDQKFIQVPQDNISLAAIATPEDDSEVIGGFLFLQADDCELIDPDRVF